MGLGEEIEIFTAGVLKRFRTPNAIENSEPTKSSAIYTEYCTPPLQDHTFQHPYYMRILATFLTFCI